MERSLRRSVANRAALAKTRNPETVAWPHLAAAPRAAPGSRAIAWRTRHQSPPAGPAASGPGGLGPPPGRGSAGCWPRPGAARSRVGPRRPWSLPLRPPADHGRPCPNPVTSLPASVSSSHASYQARKAGNNENQGAYVVFQSTCSIRPRSGPVTSSSTSKVQPSVRSVRNPSKIALPSSCRPSASFQSPSAGISARSGDGREGCPSRAVSVSGYSP
jgi:hypothetical protein